MKVHFQLPLSLAKKPSLIALMLLASSCWRIDCEAPRDLVIKYSGFDSSDLSTVVVSRYAPASKFSQLVYLDTINLGVDKPASSRVNYYRQHDYSDSSKWFSYIILYDNYDWQIEVPLAGRIDRISDYIINHDTRPGGLDGKASNRCYSGYEYVHNGSKEVIPKDGPYSSYNRPGHPVVKK